MTFCCYSEWLQWDGILEIPTSKFREFLIFGSQQILSSEKPQKQNLAHFGGFEIFGYQTFFRKFFTEKISLVVNTAL